MNSSVSEFNKSVVWIRSPHTFGARRTLESTEGVEVLVKALKAALKRSPLMIISTCALAENLTGLSRPLRHCWVAMDVLIDIQ